MTDTGPGFSAAALEHALEPFFTTKGGEGTGLGLAMVYDMAKLAGGRVRLSNTGQRRGAGQPAPAVAARRRCSWSPGMVLLVEDSPDLRVGIREMLRDMGHAVIEAASVDEALALLAQLPDITLILSDITLEGDASRAGPVEPFAAGSSTLSADDIPAAAIIPSMPLRPRGCPS